MRLAGSPAPLPLLALCPLVLGGCAGSGGSAGALAPADGPEVPWDVVPVVWSATEVFERYGIPVAVADEQEGIVESEPFRVQMHWNGMPVERLLSCPGLSSAGDPEIYSLPFRVTVAVRARDTGRATTRIRVSGFGQATSPRRGVSSGVRCQLRDEVRELLADEIRRDVMHLPPRRHGPALGS